MTSFICMMNREVIYKTEICYCLIFSWLLCFTSYYYRHFQHYSYVSRWFHIFHLHIYKFFIFLFYSIWFRNVLFILITIETAGRGWKLVVDVGVLLESRWTERYDVYFYKTAYYINALPFFFSIKLCYIIGLGYL